MPLYAGVVNIIGGTLGVICGHLADSLESPDTTAASILFYTALLAMGGGIFSIRREMWWLALIGSISAFLLFVFSVLAFLFFLVPYWNFVIPPTVSVFLFIGVFLGIAAVVVTILSKNEFE
jgi:hypothetical protein